MIQLISAVTFAVRDMARSVEFYKKLGFELLHGGEGTAFSSLKAGEAFVNLAANPTYEHWWWGRVVFRVVDLDGLHGAFTADWAKARISQGCRMGRAVLSHPRSGRARDQLR